MRPTPMTLTGGSNLAPLPLWRGSRGALAPRRSAATRALAPLASVLCLALAACSPPPPDTTPGNAGVCEALRPAIPVLYHGKTDTPDTVERIKQANARFAAACP